MIEKGKSFNFLKNIIRFYHNCLSFEVSCLGEGKAKIYISDFMIVKKELNLSPELKISLQEQGFIQKNY